MEAKEEDWGQPVAPVVAAYRALTPPPGLQYESARSRSKFAIGGVAILIIGLCAQIVLNIFLISQLTGGGAAGFDDGDMPVSAILAILFMVFTIVIGYVAGSVCFSMWFHRAYRNLPTLVNGQLLTTPGWAVGSFFIPFLNLFRPYQAAREIEVYSNPEFDGGRFASDVGGSGLLKLWWTLWIAGNIISRLSGRMSDAKGVEAQIAGNCVEAFSSVLIVLAGFVLIALIRKITNDQDASAERVESSIVTGALDPAQ